MGEDLIALVLWKGEIAVISSHGLSDLASIKLKAEGQLYE